MLYQKIQHCIKPYGLGICAVEWGIGSEQFRAGGNELVYSALHLIAADLHQTVAKGIQLGAGSEGELNVVGGEDDYFLLLHG